eukprot:2471935-Amphidinium_carterae.4
MERIAVLWSSWTMKRLTTRTLWTIVLFTWNNKKPLMHTEPWHPVWLHDVTSTTGAICTVVGKCPHSLKGQPQLSLELCPIGNLASLIPLDDPHACSAANLHACSVANLQCNMPTPILVEAIWAFWPPWAGIVEWSWDSGGGKGGGGMWESLVGRSPPSHLATAKPSGPALSGTDRSFLPTPTLAVKRRDPLQSAWMAPLRDKDPWRSKPQRIWAPASSAVSAPAADEVVGSPWPSCAPHLDPIGFWGRQLSKNSDHVPHLFQSQILERC